MKQGADFKALWDAVADPSWRDLGDAVDPLDKQLRERMQIELRQLHEQLGTTTIYVTHDQREAMTMSDLIVVMGTDNRVHQMGTPLEIYRNPADTFVAYGRGWAQLYQQHVTQAHEGCDFDFLEGTAPKPFLLAMTAAGQSALNLRVT